MQRNKFDLKLLNEYEKWVNKLIVDDCYENILADKETIEYDQTQVKKIKEQILDRMDSLRNLNKSKTKILEKPKYRFLKVGEIKRISDEFSWFEEDGWSLTLLAGDKVCEDEKGHYRRRIS